MATGYNIRVSDADREATASQLREHYAAGRLTLDELNERLDQTFAAKTRSELNAVMSDLPVTSRPVMPVSSSGSGWSGSGSSGSGWSGSRSSGSGSGSRRAAFAFLGPMIALFWVCVAVLAAGFLFGFGDKPFIVVAVLAVLAFLRRIIFGRARGRGRGRGRGRCGRR
jgi:hypothetical protein